MREPKRERGSCLPVGLGGMAFTMTSPLSAPLSATGSRAMTPWKRLTGRGRMTPSCCWNTMSPPHSANGKGSSLFGSAMSRSSSALVKRLTRPPFLVSTPPVHTDRETSGSDTSRALPARSVGPSPPLVIEKK